MQARIGRLILPKNRVSQMVVYWVCQMESYQRPGILRPDCSQEVSHRHQEPVNDTSDLPHIRRVHTIPDNSVICDATGEEVRQTDWRET